MAESLPQLVTAADLHVFNIDTSSQKQMDAVIDAVSAGIRSAAGAPISAITSTVEFGGHAERFFELPGGPLLSVDEVRINDQPVEYKLRNGMLYRRAGWGRIDDDVQVTWRHGWDPVPADVVKLATNLVAAGLNEAQSEEGLASRRGLVSRQESIDDYSLQESFVRGEDEVVDLTELPDRTRQWLRERFGRQAYVTGSY
ncbi:hypothetical protein [Nesterenkonia populi]|uniref:hypothetical protein n=1 Tax=Nesterenkonia populi TaxID=1591087 RepID=UPI001478441B|nr:hypothetical protein [Nesterenkonia populi]